MGQGPGLGLEQQVRGAVQEVVVPGASRTVVHGAARLVAFVGVHRVAHRMEPALHLGSVRVSVD